MRTEAKSLSAILFQHNFQTPIQPLYISGSQRIRDIAKKNQKAGFDVRLIVSPTIKRNKELLRVCLHAFNTKKEIDDFLNLLDNIQINPCTLLSQEFIQK